MTLEHELRRILALHDLTHDEAGRVLPDEAIDPEDIEALMRERG